MRHLSDKGSIPTTRSKELSVYDTESRLGSRMA